MWDWSAEPRVGRIFHPAGELGQGGIFYIVNRHAGLAKERNGST